MESFVYQLTKDIIEGNTQKAQTDLQPALNRISECLDKLRESFHPLDYPLLIASLRTYANGMAANGPSGSDAAAKEFERAMGSICMHVAKKRTEERGMKRLRNKIKAHIRKAKRWLITKLGGRCCDTCCDLSWKEIRVVERLLPMPRKIGASVLVYGEPGAFQHDQRGILEKIAKRMINTLMESGVITVRTSYDYMNHSTVYMGELLVVRKEDLR